MLFSQKAVQRLNVFFEANFLFEGISINDYTKCEKNNRTLKVEIRFTRVTQNTRGLIRRCSTQNIAPYSNRQNIYIVLHVLTKT